MNVAIDGATASVSVSDSGRVLGARASASKSASERKSHSTFLLSTWKVRASDAKFGFQF